MTIYKIRKRNGSIVTFEKEKITAAIQAAFDAVQNTEVDKISSLVDISFESVSDNHNKNTSVLDCFILSIPRLQRKLFLFFFIITLY